MGGEGVGIHPRASAFEMLDDHWRGAVGLGFA